MLIDIKTGKEIESDPVLTVSQSLVKSYDLVNRENIDSEDETNTDWGAVRRDNNALTPAILIDQFHGVLQAILEGSPIDPDYCKFMIEQCKGWEESDEFTTVE